ncbi:MAG TPA: phosphoribosylglycinamide formyltransferase [Flavisolibacter sp.]|nr:phosphoribosylglycinamide formyltransferase [Flavisolibacter sp.]
MKTDAPATGTPTKKPRLAIFASGNGSNAQKLIDFFRNANSASVALIVCNKPGAGVLGIAEKEGLPVLLIEKERFFRGDAYLPVFNEAGIDFLVLAGFLWKVPSTLINAYPRRIVNIHPALLPKFGGKGMYGQYVHEAVLQAGEMESGITIHYVDEHYDNGDIIFQTACPILEGDTPETIAQRIHQLEHLHYPRVVEEVISNVEQTDKE